MTFRFLPIQFTFAAIDPISFGDLAANDIRGALGWLSRNHPLYDQVFAPRGAGASGLKSLPRPFVFRARELSGRTFEPAKAFSFSVILFDLRSEVIDYFRTHFELLARTGLGRQRSRVRLTEVSGQAMEQALLSEPGKIARVHFVTPTDLKGWNTVAAPSFALLMARLRDRISNLRALYGEGPLALDFRSFCNQAEQVSLESMSIRETAMERRSSRTGEVQRIRGIQGVAEYRGPVGTYLPFLRLAQWTGVGRHAVWGNGELRVETD